MSARTETTGARAGARRERRRRFRRAAVAAAPAAAGNGGGEALGALQAELVLLREENARLKAAGAKEPDLGALLERARMVPAGGARAEDAADEAAQLLVDGMVMREELLALCREIARAMALMEARLAELGAEDDRAAERV